MKKLLFPVVMIALIAFASCKKDYTCTCTSTDSSGNATATSEITIHSSKQDAVDACSEQAQHTSTGSSTSQTRCELSE